LIRPGEPTEKRSEREDRHADHEHAAAPEKVGGAATEQEQAGEGERVGADHPLQPLRREVELFLDRGKRDGHDRGVQDHHEKGTAEERERPPAARVRIGSRCGDVSAHWRSS
jgi:hypothetical protein